MPYLCYQDVVLVAEIVVIFHLTRQEDIGVRTYCVGQQKGSGPSAEGYLLDKSSRHTGVFHAAHFEQFLHATQKVGLCFRLFQLAHQSRTGLCPFVLQGIEVVGRFS